mgnify:CR=1 FL=1
MSIKHFFFCGLRFWLKYLISCDISTLNKIEVPMSLLVDAGSLLYARVRVFHPDWLIRSNFRLRRSDNLHKDSQQNSWIHE